MRRQRYLISVGETPGHLFQCDVQGAPVRHQWAMLNGAPALFLYAGDTLASVMWIECDADRISAIHALRHPDKLARLATVTNPTTAASLH